VIQTIQDNGTDEGRSLSLEFDALENRGSQVLKILEAPKCRITEASKCQSPEMLKCRTPREMKPRLLKKLWTIDLEINRSH
jgi:hypothetical protein